MDNRIDVNYMTKTYQDFIKSHTAASPRFAGYVKDGLDKQDQKGKCTCPQAGNMFQRCAVLNVCPEVEPPRAQEAQPKGMEEEALKEPVCAGEGSDSSDMEAVYKGMEIICGCEDSQCCSGTEEVVKTPEEMTLEEYKQYIRDKISRIPMHPSQIKNSVSIHISDAGFLAMKNDPEYEAWVLNTIRKDFSFQDPFQTMGHGRYVVHSFGATKEEYRGYSFSKEKPSSRKRVKESYWEKRRKRQKKLQKEYYEELLKKRALIRRIQQQLFIEKDISWAAAAFLAKKIVH